MLPLFEARAPDDPRPRIAIEGIRSFARGEKRSVQLRSLALAAHAAARQSSDPVAEAVARAVGYAAATAYTHPVATHHQARHILGAAIYAARAREIASGENPDVGDEEIRWAMANASPVVRDVVRQLPIRQPGRSRLDELLYRLQEGLRH